MENGIESAVSKSSNTFVVVALSTVIVGLLGFIGYQFQTKQEDVKVEPQKLSFSALPVTIQDNYILVEDARAQQNNLQQKIKQLEKGIMLRDSQLQADSILTQREPEIREKVVEKIVLVKDELDRTNFKTYTCKTFGKSSIEIPSRCEKSIGEFLEKNKDAKLYEIIGLVDNSEFRLIQRLEDVYGTKEVKEIKKYVQKGLSRQRVVEVTWFIKEHFKKLGKSDYKLNAVNYTLYSKNKRGVVLKAYY